MSVDDLVKWSSLAMPLILAVSTLIAIMVFRFTRRQAQMEALKLVHSRWQDINRAMIDRPDIQRLLGDERFNEKSDEDVIVYNFIFQILKRSTLLLAMDMCLLLQLSKNFHISLGVKIPKLKRASNISFEGLLLQNVIHRASMWLALVIY